MNEKFDKIIAKIEQYNKTLIAVFTVGGIIIALVFNIINFGVQLSDAKAQLRADADAWKAQQLINQDTQIKYGIVETKLNDIKSSLDSQSQKIDIVIDHLIK